MIKYILFDLDDTLYSTETGLMAAIGQRIHQYMQERVGLDPVMARDLRRHYLQTYGTTLKGLQVHYNIDTDDYLSYVHNVPLGDYLKPDEALDRALTEIQAEKIVFTNATTEHAHRVLRFLGIEHHFSRIIDLRATNYQNKPQPGAYQYVLDILGARPEECLIVEDSMRNLRPAKEMGMVTVLVNGSGGDGVDFAIDDVNQVVEVFRQIRDSRFQDSRETMINKVTTLTEAVKLVREGDMLALGGMTLYRRPVAFVRELIRQGTGDLILLAFTASFASDLLVGAGLVRRVRSCYFGMEAFGLAPMFTKLATAGQVKVIEETEASIAFGLRAALAGVGFMPGQGWVETDLLKVRPDVKLVDDPYSDRRYAAFPAIKPDVAVIHARLADPYGNAVLGGNLAVDWELTMGSERVIITAERVVDKLEERADTVGLRVTAVVEAPGGAKPTSCYPDYPLDSAEILRYVETCNSNGFENYLEEFLELRIED